MIVTSVICLKVERNRLVLLHQPPTPASVSRQDWYVELQKVQVTHDRDTSARWAHAAPDPGAGAVSVCAAWELHLLQRRRRCSEGSEEQLPCLCVPPQSKSLHFMSSQPFGARWSAQHTAAVFSPCLLPFFCPSFYPASPCNISLPLPLTCLLKSSLSAYPQSRQSQNQHSCLVHQSQLHHLQHLPQLRQPHE